MTLAYGSKVRGSWNNNIYQVVKSIGQGSFGQVFLVESPLGQKYALKLSSHVTSITNEYKNLMNLNKNKNLKKLEAIPSVFDSDDCTMEDNLYRFIVLEYFEGEVLSSKMYQQKLAEKEIIQIGLSLLKIIHCLHEQELVLGDLKPANIFYRSDKPLRIIDLGGVTPFGHKLEEYTPLFDRETWGLGKRVADPQYDIFSCCLLLLVLSGSNLLSQQDDDLLLYREIQKAPWSEQLKEIIRQGISGEFDNCHKILERLEKLNNLQNVPKGSRKVWTH